MFLSLCLLVVAALTWLFLVLKSWLMPVLPGPRGLPFFGIALKLAFKPHRELYTLMKYYVEKFQGVYTAQFAGHRYAITTTPEAVQVLLSSTNEIQKGVYEYSFWTPFLREGLLISKGDKWRNRRKLLTPTFHFKILEDSMSSFTKNAESLASNLLATRGEQVDIDDLIRSTTLKIICETAMGVEMNKESKQNHYEEAVKRLPETIMKRFLEFWVHNDFIYKLTKSGREFYKDLNTVHSFTKMIIDNRKKLYIEQIKSGMKTNNKQKKAFLDCLLEMHISNQFFSEEDICEEVDTFMFEGHDTTSASLLFTMYLLANHPEEQVLLSSTKEIQKGVYGYSFWTPFLREGLLISEEQRKAFLDCLLEMHISNQYFSEEDICEEVDTFMFEQKVAEEMMENFGNDDRPPTMLDLTQMNYLEMVIKESLRLYPSVPFLSRTLSGDLKISDGLVIPSGYTVIVSTYFVHRTKGHWENPEEFRPERFAPGASRHPFSFIPFSAGPRNCIGQRFAMLELKTILSTVIRKCRLEAVTKKLNILPTFIIKSEEPIILRIHPRNY